MVEVVSSWKVQLREFRIERFGLGFRVIEAHMKVIEGYKGL